MKILAAVLLLITMLACWSAPVCAENVPVYGSWFIRISNYSENYYTTTRVIGPDEDGVRTGFPNAQYPGHGSGSNTSTIVPTVSTDLTRLTFDFNNGEAVLGQSSAWAIPMMTLADDVIYHVKFDWNAYLNYQSAKYVRLEIWAGNNHYTQTDPYMVWSVRPGLGATSGHVDMDVPASLDYLTLKVSFAPVPEPSGLAALTLGASGLLFTARKRRWR